jgi:2-iminobutanoate/2-iminopropanoate deaminase
VAGSKQAYGGVPIGGGEPLFAAAVRYGDLLFLSGQAAIDRDTGTLVAADFAGQAEFVMARVSETLAAAGAGPDDVLRVECILADTDDFAAWNEVFAAFFTPPRPARTTFVSAFVVPGMLLEIQVTAGV